MSQNKIVSIQYLRGIAALGVVFFHYGLSLKVGRLLANGILFGRAGVHVFFLISGFIIIYALNNSGYKINRFFNFLLKRSVRIDPPYYVAILLTLLLFSLLAHIPAYRGKAIPFQTGRFIAHILYLVPFTKYAYYNIVFWTLCVEFQFYLLIGVFYFLWDNRYYKRVFLLLFSLTSFIPFINPHDLVFTYGPIFALGISLETLYRDKRLVNIALPVIMLVIIGIQFGIPILILLSLSFLAIFFLTLTIRESF